MHLKLRHLWQMSKPLVPHLKVVVENLHLSSSTISNLENSGVVLLHACFFININIISTTDRIGFKIDLNVTFCWSALFANHEEEHSLVATYLFFYKKLLFERENWVFFSMRVVWPKGFNQKYSNGYSRCSWTLITWMIGVRIFVLYGFWFRLINKFVNIWLICRDCDHHAHYGICHLRTRSYAMRIFLRDIRWKNR